MPMQEEYSFGDDNDLITESDSEMYFKHVIGEDTDLHSLNNLVADYFSTYLPVN